MGTAGKRKAKKLKQTNGDGGPSLSFLGWVVPSFTKDSMIYGTENENRQEIGNSAYEQLLDRLCDDGIVNQEYSLTGLNFYLYEFLHLITVNPWFSNLSFNERLMKKQENEFKFEFLIGWLIRLFNERCWVLPLVFLSIWSWKSKVPKPFWRFCTKIKLLYTLETIEMILTDLGLRLSTKKVLLEDESKASGKVILAVFDNCLINFKTSYEGIRDHGDGSRASLFIYWLIAFIDKTI
jgi:hypothetical protein